MPRTMPRIIPARKAKSTGIIGFLTFKFLSFEMKLPCIIYKFYGRDGGNLLKFS
jgi:hypothetical protein